MTRGPTHMTLWTPEEDATLLRLYNSGMTLAAIARDHLTRTDSSCKNRLVILRKNETVRTRYWDHIYKPRQIKFWTPEEVDLLRENVGLPINELTKLFPGRTKHSVLRRRGEFYRYYKASVLAKKPEPVQRERPYGVPFQTASGAMAIRLDYGVVPYLPSIHGAPPPPKEAS